MAENALSLVISTALSLICLGGRKCLSMWSQSYFLRLLPSALCFTMARILGMRALEFIDAGTLKVMSQAVLPTNAVLSSLILGTRYSKWQWQCVVLIFLTTTAFYEMRVSEDRRLDSISRGLPLFIPTLMFTSIGAVYSEMCIKAGGSMPFYYQKMMLSLASCLCVAVFAGSASLTSAQGVSQMTRTWLVCGALLAPAGTVRVHPGDSLPLCALRDMRVHSLVNKTFPINWDILVRGPGLCAKLCAEYEDSCAYWSMVPPRPPASINDDETPALCMIHLITDDMETPVVWWTHHNPAEGIASGHRGCIHEGPKWPQCTRRHDSTIANVAPLLIDASRFNIGMSPQCRDGDCTLTDSIPTSTSQLCAAICHFSLLCSLWVFNPSTEVCNIFKNVTSGEINVEDGIYGDPYCYQARFVYGSHYGSHLDASLSCWSEDFMLPEVCCSVRNHYRGYYACWDHSDEAANIEQHRTFERCCMAMDSTRRFYNLGEAVEDFAFDHRGNWIKHEVPSDSPYHYLSLFAFNRSNSMK
ncbi:hypothetical protein FOL47_004935 [Perkinsus chesapeaki]|uniref:Uncharacterized protein n=1 Tax=Perkinsus chesapeaki TaxID=330153 RepID=A0A7J6LZS9_PERCH|nr:hypothetical protein FOL47_004935 [Perkinsus chesapeaki]